VTTDSAPPPARRRRWRTPLIAGAALALAAGGVFAAMPGAYAATFNQEGWSTQAGGTTGGGSGNGEGSGIGESSLGAGAGLGRVAVGVNVVQAALEAKAASKAMRSHLPGTEWLMGRR
jgi:pectate lyase